MATTTTAALNAASGSTDYQNLLAEIKNTIDKNDNLFQQIQKINYPNAGNYSSDLLNYKIDTQVSDLTQARQTIWDFVNKKFQENTKLRSFYFDEIRKADKHISDLNKQQQELIDSVQKKKLQSTTANESIQQQKYLFDKKHYYLFLYKLLIVIQAFILTALILCLTGIIPRTTCLVIIVVILLATLAFVGYYVFYVNLGRNSFSWAKFEHSNDVKSKSGQCIDSTGVSTSDKQKAAADIAVQSVIDKSMSTKCSNPSS
jgi:hypothetical protein